MDKVECEGEKITPADCAKEFNINKHKKQAFSMFLGEPKDVELLIDNVLVDVVMDKFGEKIKMEKVDDYHFKIKVKVEISPTFFAWCFTFGNKIKILSDKKVIKKYKAVLDEVQSVY